MPPRCGPGGGRVQRGQRPADRARPPADPRAAGSPVVGPGAGGRRGHVPLGVRRAVPGLATIGETPIQKLTRYRLRRAAGYLRTTNAGIREIARLTGYESEVSVSKAFRRYFGISPGAYRRSGAPAPTAESATAPPTRATAWPCRRPAGAAPPPQRRYALLLLGPFRLLTAHANGQPAFGLYGSVGGSRSSLRPPTLHVLRLEAGLIADLVGFVEPSALGYPLARCMAPLPPWRW